MRPTRKLTIPRPARHLIRCVATFVLLVVLGACPSQTRDVPRGAELAPPPTEVNASPPAKKAKAAGARCRKRVEKARHEEFIPDTSREGSNAVLPVVFADGSSAELVYPPRLKLAELGVQPAASVGINKGKARFVHPRFLMITKTALEEFRSDDPPIKGYEGASGQVNVWRAKDPEEFLNPVFLHFRIGTWNVIVGDGNAGDFMGTRNRRVWAENLGGYETDRGFIVIEPRPPLGFATGPGRPDIYLSTCFRFIELRLQECKDLKTSKLAKDQYAQVVRGVTVHRNEMGRGAHANWCTPSRQMSVYVSDHNKQFVDLAVKQLEIRNVKVNENPD